MALIAVMTGEHAASTPSARSIVALLYLIVFGSLVAFSAYGYLLRHTRPAIATSYAYVNPLVAIAIGVTFAHERIALATGAGTAVILLGVLLLSRAKKIPAQAVEAPDFSTPARAKATTTST